MKKITLLLFVLLTTWSYGQCTFGIGASQNPGNPFEYGFGHSFQGVVTSIVWHFGDGDSANFNGGTHLYTSPGTYIYCVTINACPPVCDTLTIGGAVTDCNFSVAAFNPPSTPPLFYGFQTTVSGIPNSIIWDFGDGDTSSALFASHTYASPGVYVYCLSIDSCPLVCDTIVTAGIGIEENEMINFNSYPNPVNDYLNVTFNLTDKSDIQFNVYSLSGSLVLEQTLEGNVGENNAEIKMTDLSKGVYLLQLINGGNIQNTRIIKL